MERKHAITHPARDAHKYNDLTLDARLHHFILQVQEGRLLPESVPVSSMQNVLDLGCGGGDWLFEMSRRYPALHLYGVDYCEKALQQAQLRREISGRLQIEVRRADFLRPFAIPDGYLDLLHMRRCANFIAPLRWPQLIWECTRTLKVGGWIVFVEFEAGEMASSAFMTLYHSMLQTLTLLKQNMDVTGMSYGALQRIYSFLHSTPFDQIDYTIHAADVGFKNGESGRTFLAALFQQIEQHKTHIIQQKLLSEEYFNNLLARARSDIQAPDFCGWVMITSIYGRRSAR